MKSILVTSCAGFIGSNFVPYFLKKYPDYYFAAEGQVYDIGGHNV